MTWAEVELACKGYETRMARLKEVPRMIAAILLNVHKRSGTGTIAPERVFPLYTDKKGTDNLLTLDEYNEMIEEHKRWQKI